MARKRKDKRHASVRPIKQSYMLVVDGQTEQWYFNALKSALRSIPVHIKPELPSKKGLRKQREYIEENIEEEVYDKIFWLLDLDQILHQDQLRTLQTETGKLLRKYDDKVEILVNNPCLELWILLHFEFTGRIFPNCDEVERRLKNYFPNYKKTEKFYIRRTPTIFEELREKTSGAVANAKRLGDFDWNEPRKSVAEIYKLIEKIIT